MIGTIPTCVYAVCHIVKNYIVHLLNTKVPLILGNIHNFHILLEDVINDKMAT